MTSLTKNPQPQQEKFFRVQAGTLPHSFAGLNSSLAQSAEGAMALVRQPKTDGFRLISRYEYIVHQLSRCQSFSFLLFKRAPVQ